MSVPRLYTTFQGRAQAKKELETQLPAHMLKTPAAQANGRAQVRERMTAAGLSWNELEQLALAQHAAGRYPGLTVAHVRHELAQLQA